MILYQLNIAKIKILLFHNIYCVCCLWIIFNYRLKFLLLLIPQYSRVGIKYLRIAFNHRFAVIIIWFWWSSNRNFITIMIQESIIVSVIVVSILKCCLYKSNELARIMVIIKTIKKIHFQSYQVFPHELLLLQILRIVQLYSWEHSTK